MPNILVIAPTTANIFKVIIDGFRNYAPEVHTDNKKIKQAEFEF